MRHPAAICKELIWSEFHIVQALVFCNAHEEGAALADRLSNAGFPSAFVSGSHAQVCARLRPPA